MSGFTGLQCNETVVDDNKFKGVTLVILLVVAIYIPISFIFIFILACVMSSIKAKLGRQEQNTNTTADSRLKRTAWTERENDMRITPIM